MKAAGKKYDPVIYDGAGHGFMRAGQAPDASDANKKAYDDSFKRMVGLLAQARRSRCKSPAEARARHAQRPRKPRLPLRPRADCHDGDHSTTVDMAAIMKM